MARQVARVVAQETTYLKDQHFLNEMIQIQQLPLLTSFPVNKSTIDNSLLICNTAKFRKCKINWRGMAGERDHSSPDQRRCIKTTKYQNRGLGYLTSPVWATSLWQNVG
jgi:hypothetical protein